MFVCRSAKVRNLSGFHYLGFILSVTNGTILRGSFGQVEWEKKVSSLCSCLISFLCQVFLQGGINQEEIPELTAGAGGERCWAGSIHPLEHRERADGCRSREENMKLWTGLDLFQSGSSFSHLSVPTCAVVPQNQKGVFPLLNSISLILNSALNASNFPEWTTRGFGIGVCPCFFLACLFQFCADKSHPWPRCSHVLPVEPCPGIWRYPTV